MVKEYLKIVRAYLVSPIITEASKQEITKKNTLDYIQDWKELCPEKISLDNASYSLFKSCVPKNLNR